ncbi:ABC transporter substrate-binding protein [Alloscardovia theropitheci]|uniref:ABC transporter substrate-binding protein n=1 Tax=Alloscardovia theropitheci TaxID=2496842 RepID=A0A4V2MTY8_9BIFI|nr:ABC transporter substrate-binding protein [Alloscardovia theropitheci]TCD54269.1 ABC transporter substrate-binding protein [Alloscardovia theropitheci]
MKFGKSVKVVAGLAAATLLLAGCGSGKSASSGSASSESTPAVSTAVPDTITAQVAYSGQNYNPLSTSSAIGMAGNWHVVEPLYTRQMDDFKIVSGLAKGEPKKISDTEYEITLRDGAKFSDGNPVTAKDVKSSFDRMMVEGSLFLPMLNFIQSVDVKSDNVVTFKLSRPYTLLKERLALVGIVPESMSDEDLQKMPIGSGPYKYTEITDLKVTFERNDNYNGEFKALSKNMVWNVAVDDTARVTAMQSGQNDIMENVPAKAFDTLKNSKSTLSKAQSFNQAFIMFNTKKAPFDKKEVRQAVFYGIDVETLIKNQLADQAEAATGFLPKSFKYYHKAKNVYTYNVDKAKKLLKDAGVKEGVEFTLYTTDHTWITELAPQVKNNLEALGFKVNIESMKSAALYPNIAAKPDYSMIMAPGDPSVFGNDPEILLNWWFGDNAWTQTRTFWKGSEGYNKLQEILTNASTMTDDKEREATWNDAMDLISEEVPLYPLFHRQLTTATRTGVFKDFKPTGTTGLYLLDQKLSK